MGHVNSSFNYLRPLSKEDNFLIIMCLPIRHLNLLTFSRRYIFLKFEYLYRSRLEKWRRNFACFSNRKTCTRNHLSLHSTEIPCWIQRLLKD